MHLDVAMRFTIWTAALAAGLVAFSVAAYRRTAPPLPPARRALLRALRAASFAILALLVVNPAIVMTRTETRPPLVIVLLDRSRSMGTRDAGGRARLDAALEDAARLRSELSRKQAAVVVLPFADALAPDPLPADGVVAPDRDGTDIRGAIDAAGDRYPGAVAAVVLLSDGRTTRGMVASGRNANAPVFAVGYGDTARGADVAVEEVVADRIAYRGVGLPVEAVIRAEGFRGSSVEVRLIEDGKRVGAAVLAVRRDSELLSVVFDYVPEREGARRLTVEAVPGRPERDRGNNSESIRIDVRKEKVRLLYVDDLADWNSAFLRDLVVRSERLEGEIALGAAGRGFVLDPGGTRWTFPRASSGLARYDLVIISDDARLFAERTNVETLVRYVEEGGSALFLADEGSPMARGGDSFGLLEPALPVRRAGTPRVEYAECFVKVSAEAAGERFAAMLGSARALSSMPPLPARIAGVVETAGAEAPFTLESGSSVGAFLAIDRRGDGLTAAVLGFPLWRWKLAGPEGARVYESFLGGLVLYLAEGAKSPPLAIDADRTVYRSGDRVRLTASTGDRDAPGTLRGELRRAGDPTPDVAATFLFEPDPRRRGVYRASLEGLAPGSYSAVAVEAPGAGVASSPVAFTVEPASVEFLDVSRDGSLLARIAAESGGAYVERGALDSIVAAFDLSGRSVERRSARELRGSMLALFGLVGLLGAEWIARKGWGLV